jgi:4-hydroxy-tetrahydrodipicolinate synthase
MFEGSFVALVTPFKNGILDEEGLRKNVQFQIENGTHGLVPCGTTGEAPTLTEEEHARVVEIVVKESGGRIPVIAGTGSNSTQKTIANTQRAKDQGVNGALVVSPYYNKPTQEGLYQHFHSVASEADLPLILYNIPGRTGVNIEPETIARLSKLKQIVGVKEASGSLDSVSAIRSLCDEEFIVLSGDDSLTLPMMAVGSKGVISVIANIVPRDLSRMVESFLNGEISQSRELHQKLFPLTKAMFVETNPIPIKTAMDLVEMPAGGVRLPLAPMSDVNLNKLKKALKEYGLL